MDGRRVMPRTAVGARHAVPQRNVALQQGVALQWSVALRDTLLPKLVSGELRVAEAERWGEEAEPDASGVGGREKW